MANYGKVATMLKSKEMAPFFEWVSYEKSKMIKEIVACRRTPDQEHLVSIAAILAQLETLDSVEGSACRFETLANNQRKSK